MGDETYPAIKGAKKRLREENAERALRGEKERPSANGLKVTEEVAEVGSGLNGHRKKLVKLLATGKPIHLHLDHHRRTQGLQQWGDSLPLMPKWYHS